MNILKRIRFSLPLRQNRLEKLETLQLSATHSLHLVRVDGQEYLLLGGGGQPVILPTFLKPNPCPIPVQEGTEWLP